MKNIILIIVFTFSATLFAQKFTLQGVVNDENNANLEGATVFIQSIKDSIPIAYGITNKSGAFSINVNTETDTKAIFNIAYLGYAPYSQIINVPTDKDLNMGTVVLKDKVEELNVISIVAKAPPIVIKKDTIEYNAGSFKTLPNDKAEDLLRKLPGVEIDLEGKITVHGVAVEAVNVDGMEFFGEKSGDIALKNLPSSAINKVQVTDYKTKEQKFTGEASDSNTKEINLTIKKGQNKALFGDVKVGYGTDEKYQGNANVFQMIDGKQIGIIAGTNNINLSRGFNALPDTETSNGYIKSDFIGANYTKGKWDETNVNGNYRYSTQDSDNAQKSYTENFLPNLNYISNSESTSFRDSESHRAGSDLKFILKPKNSTSRNRVQLSNELNFNADNSESGSQTNSTSNYTNGDLVSKYQSVNNSTAKNNQLNNTFRVTALTGNFDFINVSLSTNFGQNDSEGKKISENILYNRNTTIYQNQINDANTNSSNINLFAFYSKQVAKNFRIIPKYSAIVNTNKNKNDVLDFNSNFNSYSDFNTLLSTDSRYVTNTVMPALRFRYDLNNYRFEVEGAYTNTLRSNKDALVVGRNFKNNFEYLTYSGSIKYRDPNGFKNINLNYNQNVNLPTVNQLQPVEDVSNITNIFIGNPLLNPEIAHNISFNYQNNLAYNNINITGNANVSMVNDKIISSTITDDDLNKITSYSNIDGNYNMSGLVAVSKSFYNKKTNFTINTKLNASFNNDLSIQNELKFAAQKTTITPSLSFNYSFDKKIEFKGSYNYSMVTNKYDTDVYSDNDYFIQNLDFDTSIYFFKNLFVSNKLSYRYNSRVGDEFDGSAIFWNAGIGAELWDNKATVTLVGYDMLGKNNGYRRNVAENYIQDVENKILEQYFMLNFTYKFGTFAGQKMNNFDSGSSGHGGPPRQRRVNSSF